MSSPRPRSPIGTPTSATFQNGLGLGHPGRRKSGLRSRGTQLLALRFGWVVLVIWYEVGEFFSSLSSCKFPDSQLRPTSSSSSRFSRRPSAGDPPTHLVLLADPHVPHPRLSYPPDSRPWINLIRQAMDELFMRKSWNVVMRLGRVDGVIVLGDMLDWGRGAMSDEDYESYFSIFSSIFRLPDSVPMYYVPGNHDIPLGPNRLFSPLARDRYARHFSPPNEVLQVANHSLILLDAVGLVEEDYRRYAAEMQFGEWDGVEGGVIEFVKALGEAPPSGPKILLSHIPLARPESASCGPHRESGRIYKGAGPGYQNLLGSETSRFLLEALRPSIVFSGDDHDYCDLTHQGGIREVTVKSFSSSAGIRRPGLQLLSLVPPDPVAPYTSQKTLADRPCFLPDQVGVYTWVYLPLAILTMLFLFATNVRSAWQRWSASNHSAHSDTKSRLSPALQPGEFGTGTARRASDRPSPLSLPSRKSSQQLGGLTVLTPSASSFAARPHRLGSMVDVRSARSAPVSPTASPRLGYYDEKEEDVESVLETPNLSRRSSYIYMNGPGNHYNGENNNVYQTPGPISSEPPSYFLPLPNGENTGLGFATPQSGSSMGLRRASSSVSTNTNTYGHGYAYAQPGSGSVSPAPSATYPGLPHGVQRRVTMPRPLTSAGDWSAAAKAKDKSVLGLMIDSLPLPGTGTRRPGARGGVTFGWEAIKGFLRWTWKTRNGVVARSWRETLKVAWPAGIVWVVVNALFFID